VTNHRSARILVATDSLSDADLVRKLLSDEFDNVSISTDPDRSVEDFERRKPEVLVLAFNTLEKAERYYLGLYRRGTTVHALLHRTVILCNKDDVQRVYELCKKEYFDDYILFWPMTHDPLRLPMTVHHALRQMTASRSAPANTLELAAQARRIAELEAQLERYAARGLERVDEASRSLRAAGQHIGAALDSFGRQLVQGDLRDLVELKDRSGFESELGRFKAQQIEPRIRAAVEAVAPVRQWAGGFKEALAAQIESARSLKALADEHRPLVLMVDDDEFQHRLLAQVLDSMKLELIFATSGAEALGALRKRRPDLVLMDIELPDISGVEVTRRMKAVEQFAGIPVVMITGHSERHQVIDSLRAGATDFVVKPFDKATLLAKLRKLLGLAGV
jgi:CheY-like chemotaxis protein